MARLRHLHPPLVAAAFVLFVYAQNVAFVEPQQLLAPLLVAVGGALVALGAAHFTLRDGDRAALVTSLFLLLFFLFGRTCEALLGSLIIAPGLVGQDVRGIIPPRAGLWFLLVCFLLLFVAGTAFIRRRRGSLETPANALAVGATLFLLFSLPAVLQDIGSSPAIPGESDQGATATDTVPPAPARPAELPDIYYIILDAYARHDVLRAIYQLDNRPFISALEQRGFYVARQSYGNYPMTFLSLASSLNFRYLRPETESVRLQGPPYSHEPFYTLIRDSRIARTLQQFGYRYAHFATGWSGTDRPRRADVVHRFRSPLLASEFVRVLVGTTALRVAEPDLADMHLEMLERAATVPALKGPVFAFLHLMLPHPPYVFDRNGRVIDRVPLRVGWGAPASFPLREHAEQTLFTNQAVLSLIDRILSSSERQPIIILQSDHGPAGLFGGIPESFWWVRSAILNAYLVPPSVRAGLYPTITPVNSFRTLLREGFGLPLPNLPDSVFISWYEDPHQPRPTTPAIMQDSVGRMLARLAEQNRRRQQQGGPQ